MTKDLEFKDLLNLSARQAPRKALEEGKRIPRIKKGDIELRSDPLSEQELDVYLNKIDRVIRWNHFLTHVNINAHELIDLVTGGMLDQDSPDFKRFRVKVIDNSRSYKSTVLKAFEAVLLHYITPYLNFKGHD
jgi:hypothetical protein